VPLKQPFCESLVPKKNIALDVPGVFLQLAVQVPDVGRRSFDGLEEEWWTAHQKAGDPF
jgi:hypothetical protein